MPDLKNIRTSLEVGFPDGELPERFARYRGKAFRQIPLGGEFPFDDAQFDVVVMNGALISPAAVKEAHRVLRPAGSLLFTVPEKTKKQEGYTLPDIYSLVRDGYNIVEFERPAWWLFGRRGRTITIRAEKKNWKTIAHRFRPYV